MSGHPTIDWQEKGEPRSARWRSENAAPPQRVVIADDRMTADAAFHLACEGNGLLWRGDFQNARQLLRALAHRADQSKAHRAGRRQAKAAEAAAPAVPKDTFNRYRMAQAQRARILGMLLLQFTAAHTISLPRAPDVSQACDEAYGPADEPYVASLRELLGVIGAHEWRRNGIPIAALGGRIHPHYGVFAPLRSEYVELVAHAPLPAALASANATPVTSSSALAPANTALATSHIAIDVGTGTGVLAALLSRRGVARVLATDSDPRALACARENIARLDLVDNVEVIQADLFPDARDSGKAGLVVCNPPWIPGRPTSPLEHSIYDPDSRMLRRFLAGLAAHLAPAGEGWLVLSDLAEHLGLRTRAELLAWIAAAGLQVLARTDIKPRHPRVADQSDPLHAARAAEVTSLWRLAAG
ncbi:MAG: class I SAM-dependent methyltransferase [Betaproteobacteria bacterium]|nr:class I SAM-dependent methyltransferase [Betaproteobacteria bacterium]